MGLARRHCTEVLLLIFCNRPGGFNLFGLELRLGENLVDDDVWADVRPRLDPCWLDALTTPRNGGQPELVLSDGAGRQVETARDKIAKIETCQDLVDLDQLLANESRKTVLAAAEKRMDELTADDITEV